MALTTQVLKIAGGTSFARYPNISPEATYNMIKSSQALTSFIGYKKRLTIPVEGTGRATFVSTTFDKMIVVFDRFIYAITSVTREILNYNLIGQMNELGTNVFVSENNAGQIVFVNGTNSLYIYNYLTSTFSIFTLAFKAAYITFMDGYFISVDSESNRWYLSRANDAMSWSTNDSARIQVKADICVGVQRLDTQLFVFGKKSGTVYTNVGATGVPGPFASFPFAVNKSINLDYGLLSPESMANNFGLLVWLGVNEKSSPALLVSTGGSPKALGDTEDKLDFLLSQLDNPEDSTGTLVKIDGHIYYFLIFRSDNLSICYDFKNSLFYYLTDTYLNYFIGRRYEYFNNTHYFISYKDSSIYEFGSEILNYDGRAIPRFRTFDNLRISDSSLLIGQKVTVQLQTNNSVEDQKVELLISKNSGRTFGNTVARNIGGISNKNKLISFWNLGRSDDLVLMLRFWAENSRFSVTAATITVDIEVPQGGGA